MGRMEQFYIATNRLEGTLWNRCTSRLRAMATAKPPAVLFHYTAAPSFVQILGSSKIYASHYRFLNDSTEFRWLSDTARHFIGARLREAGGPLPVGKVAGEPIALRRAILDTLGKASRSEGLFGGFAAFVACFSEHDDVLSQWRSYGDDGHGFAIGFSPEALIEAGAIGGAEIGLWRVIYGSTEQLILLDALIDDLVIAMTQVYETEGHERLPLLLETVPRVFARAFAVLSAVSKHPTFKEEAEWRCVVIRSDPFRVVEQLGALAPYPGPVPDELLRELDGVRVRAGARRLVPYMEIDIKPVGSPASIVVGPCQDADVGVRVAELWLRQAGIETQLGVRRSAVPYRS